MKQSSSLFRWSCGGLDAAADKLADLKPSDVPDAEPPPNTRKYLEQMGYKVRHKFNNHELQKLNKSGLQPVKKKQQKHKAKKTIEKTNVCSQCA